MSKISKKGVVIVLSIIGLSAIGTGGGFFWQHYRSPEKIIKKMTEDFLKINSLEYSGSLNITTNEKQAKNGSDGKPPLINYKLPGNISINFNGASQMGESEDKGRVGFATLSLKDPDDEENNIGLDMKTIDKVFYLALQDQSQINKLDLTPFKGFWVKVDPQALMKQFGLDKLEEKDQKEGEDLLSKEKWAEFQKSFANSAFFKITKKLSPEVINGVETKHYQVSFDKEELIEFAAEAGKTIQNNDKSPETMEKEMAELREKLVHQEMLPGEIWIGQKDSLPYRIMYALHTQADQTSKVSIDYSLLLNFSNYNQPVVVEAPKPEEVKTVEELMAAFLKKPGFDSQAVINQSSPPVPVGVDYYPHEPLLDKGEPTQ